MANRYRATLLRVEADSNPEEAIVPFEAASKAEAADYAALLLDGDLHGMGWRSYSDPVRWGKVQRKVLGIEHFNTDTGRWEPTADDVKL
jgi:hypothetical protein